MKTITLTKGFFAIVDDSYFLELNKYKWHYLSSGGYAARKYKNKRLLMHREILLAPNNLCVDHINHNGLDNRKENLRLCSKQENCRNQLKKINTLLPYKGVKIKESGKFESTIRISPIEDYYIGTFNTLEDAAIAYDIKAKEYFGEFAYLNFENISQDKIDKIKSQIANPKKKNGNSIYRGVYSKFNKFYAAITKNNVIYNLGSFKNEIDAAIAYNNKAIELLGNKAKLNIIIQ